MAWIFFPRRITSSVPLVYTYLIRCGNAIVFIDNLPFPGLGVVRTFRFQHQSRAICKTKGKKVSAEKISSPPGYTFVGIDVLVKPIYMILRLKIVALLLIIP